jgi:hypothetical protein
MRALVAVFAFLLLAPLTLAEDAEVPAFGAWTDPVLAEYLVPLSRGAPEPTIGIPWNTDSVFYHAGSTTMRARFDVSDIATWDDVTPIYQIPTNLDPMLHADPDFNRIWAGGLHGPCSIMMYSDDDGETWLPTINMCSGVRFDHQSIGSGKAVLPSVGGMQAYYCGQLGAIACAFSIDGGVTWAPFQEVAGPCAGFHGHIRVSPTTGFVAVPVPACGGDLGFVSTADGGLTWRSNPIPGTEEWTNGFDPSLQFTRGSGWLYYGMASEHGIHVGLSKDEGATWKPIGGGMGIEPTAWLDIGQFHDPPIVSGTFVDVQAGDDDRVAVSFLGLEGGDDADSELLKSNQIYACAENQDKLVWHYYVAFSYDAGDTWTVMRITDDPVQVGGIYDSVVGGGGGCRNLLDFNDMDIDSQGRVHIAWADGCVRECAATGEPDTDGYRTQVGKLFRQTGGRGLFAAYDLPEPVGLNATADPDLETGEAIPAPAFGLLAVALGLISLAARRERD